MKLYVVSLCAGLLVGLIYYLLGVRSPAPPLIALVGLMGILLGEQIVPFGKQLISMQIKSAPQLGATGEGQPIPPDTDKMRTRDSSHDRT